MINTYTAEDEFATTQTKTKAKTKKNQYKYNLSALYCMLTFLGTSIFLEITNFLWLGIGFLPKYFILDLSILLIACGIISLYPNFLAQKINCAVILFLQVIVNIVNVTLYNVFGSFLTINMLSLGAEAATAFSFEFLDVFNILFNLAIFAGYITAIVFITKKVKKEITLKKVSKYIIFLAMFLVCEYVGFLGYGLSVNSFETSSNKLVGNDHYLYTSLYLSTEAFRKFGTYGYYSKQVLNVMFDPYLLDDTAEIDNAVSVLKSGEDFYENNTYSGILENYNVVNILLESYDSFSVNPIFTPTMWQLATQTGVNCSNFFGKNKTNVSEGIANLGSMPRETSLQTFSNTMDIYAPYSLPNQIKADAKSKNQTVVTSYVHSYQRDFYGRSTTHPMIGFDQFYCIEDVYGSNVTPTIDDRVLEVEFAQKTMDYILPTNVDRFYTAYSTMTTHGGYELHLDKFSEHEQFVEQNYELYKIWLEANGYTVPDNDYIESLFKVYLARTIDMDNAVKLILEEMEERGLADNTLIVLYGDHCPYYNDLSATIKGYSKDEYYNSRNNNIPLILYAKDLPAGTYENFCSHYSIYPTICDLLGLPYNSQFIQGRSIFANESEIPNMFVSFMAGIYNKYFYTENLVNVTYCDTVTNPNDVNIEDVNKFLTDAENFFIKQEMVEKVYTNNLFAYLK